MRKSKSLKNVKKSSQSNLPATTTTTTKKAPPKPAIVSISAFKPTIHMPLEFQKQVDILHREVDKGIEWSGLLVFEDNGKFDTPQELEITLIGVYPMNIGTSGYTEFKTDTPAGAKKIAKAVRQFKIAENKYKFGMIHTHHSMSMGTTFSGVDMSELQDNADNFQYYLSLIVHYTQAPTAKIAFSLKEHIMSIQEGSIGFQIRHKVPQIIVVDCDIKKEKEELETIPWIEEAINTLKEEKKPVTTNSKVGNGFPYQRNLLNSTKNTRLKWIGQIDSDVRESLADFWDALEEAALNGEVELDVYEKTALEDHDIRALWVYLLSGDDSKGGSYKDIQNVLDQLYAMDVKEILQALENNVDSLTVAYFYKWFAADMSGRDSLKMLAKYSWEVWAKFFKKYPLYKSKYFADNAKEYLQDFCEQWEKIPGTILSATEVTRELDEDIRERLELSD